MHVVVGVVADTSGHPDSSASAVLVVLAEAGVHVPLHPAYVSQASSLGSASTTWACGVHRLLYVETQRC